MPLRKATQAVISLNICTTDTSQTITGNKIFSNANVTGSLIGNVIGNVTGNVTGSASLNVLKTGDTMTGALIVPAGATGFQTPRASEVVSKTGDTMTGSLVVSTNTSTNALRVTQIGTGNAILVEDDVSPDASPFVVKSDGKVGIGTLLPNNALDVVGDVYVAGTLNAQNLQAGGGVIPTFTARINGSIANITSISAVSYIPNGPVADVTMTRTSHGLLVDDSITFIGQTGNNAALNGTWKINASSTDTFTFTILSYPASLSSAGITALLPIRIARFISVFDAGYGSFTPNSIGKDADGTFQINFYNARGSADYLAFGNACNSGIATGSFSPFGYSTNFFSFRTHTTATSTLANFSDINIQIY